MAYTVIHMYNVSHKNRKQWFSPRFEKYCQRLFDKDVIHMYNVSHKNIKQWFGPRFEKNSVKDYLTRL